MPQPGIEGRSPGISSHACRAVLCAGICAIGLLSTNVAWAVDHHVTPADDLPSLFWSLQPGDVVYFADGEYTPAIQNPPYNHLLVDAKNGSPAQWTVLKAEPGARPRIVMGAQTGLTIKNSSFVRIEGLELKGTGQDECEGGIQVIGSHDVQVVGNRVHDFGGSGIEGFHSQLLVENNVVWHNNWRAHYGASGISVYGGTLLASDNSFFGGDLGNPGNQYEIIIRNNVLFDNRQQNKTSGGNFDGTTDDVTDGNAIILDRFDLNGNQLHSLVANNVGFYNGGRCVHLYETDHADVVNNTCYQNLAFILPNEAELSSSKPNNRFVNNVVFATEGQRGKNGPSEQFVKNLFFHASMVDGNNILDQDPMFLAVPASNPANDAGDQQLDAEGYFRIAPESPAVAAGMAFDGVGLDRVGQTRSSPPSLGAYEPSNTAGAGGVSGASGAAGGGGGSSGASGMSGSAGISGTAGSAGEGGQAGSSGNAGGTAGGGTNGTGMGAGEAGAGGKPAAESSPASSNDGSCACRTHGERTSTGEQAFLLGWLAYIVGSARRRSRKSTPTGLPGSSSLRL